MNCVICLNRPATDCISGADVCRACLNGSRQSMHEGEYRLIPSRNIVVQVLGRFYPDFVNSTKHCLVRELLTGNVIRVSWEDFGQILTEMEVLAWTST